MWWEHWWSVAGMIAWIGFIVVFVREF
ncbi:hypothetical protein GJ25_gp061 [Mycobacterium phage Hawkeye]|uniref:Uncharacterized protein n=1 Tax=Mycobacterium phage Hawkeye TaxID=1458711 RepID=X2KN86_9CAUD|nr:hypothetical protein GJ25_gp061 [Mycobacterium phage Hawkeye]AHN84072.1 hypothetical protein PBI_HAWKEYE_61 [Mycobacterium phage Hawkeye]